MKSTRTLLFALCLCASPWLAMAQGAAANFPNKPIKILVPFNAGSGVVAVQATRQLPADGYTILMGSNSPVGGLPVTHIPYKGGAQMLTDVVGG